MRPKVLYVDDSELARAAATRLLGARGLDVVVAGSLSEARRVEAASLKVALLDLEIGEDVGPAVAAHLRERAPGLAIAFLTATEGGELLDSARAIGPVFRKDSELDRAVAWVATRARAT
ncbi:MAG TPA: response regulator [Polyangiaceae bacterium]|nr:response regulator [Polyangiaceae bacterium]